MFFIVDVIGVLYRWCCSRSSKNPMTSFVKRDEERRHASLYSWSGKELQNRLNKKDRSKVVLINVVIVLLSFIHG